MFELLPTPEHLQGLSAIRNWHGLSLQALADLTGYDRSGIHRWETGKSTPGTDKIARLAEVMRCDISQLMPAVSRKGQFAPTSSSNLAAQALKEASRRAEAHTERLPDDIWAIERLHSIKYGMHYGVTDASLPNGLLTVRIVCRDDSIYMRTHITQEHYAAECSLYAADPENYVMWPYRERY